MSLLRPPKHPRWLPRYSRPQPVGALVFVLVVVILVMYFLLRVRSL
jgi:hypothetical protein